MLHIQTDEQNAFESMYHIITVLFLPVKVQDTAKSDNFQALISLLVGRFRALEWC